MSTARTPTSLHKFLGEQDPRHGGPLLYPGAETGLPVRGAPGLLHQAEADRLVTVGDFKARMFVMDDPESADFREYTWVMDHVVNGQFSVLLKRELYPSATDPRMRIWLEWVQRYAEMPALERSTPGLPPL